MSEHEPTTQTLTISDVKNRLSRLLNEVSRTQTRVIVEKAGIPVAAIVSIDDLRRLARLDRERAERAAVIERVRDAFADVLPEEIERETDRIIARNRAAVGSWAE